MNDPYNYPPLNRKDCMYLQTISMIFHNNKNKKNYLKKKKRA